MDFGGHRAHPTVVNQRQGDVEDAEGEYNFGSSLRNGGEFTNPMLQRVVDDYKELQEPTRICSKFD